MKKGKKTVDAHDERKEISGKREGQGRKKNSVLKKIVLVLALVVWVGGVYLLVQFLLGKLLVFIFQPTSNSSALQTLYTILCYVVSGAIIILVPWLINKKWKPTLEDLGIIELPTWTDIGLAPGGFIVYMVMAWAAELVFVAFFPWFNATEKQDVGYNSMLIGPERILALMSLVLVAPIVEELIFRGFLYGNLKKVLAPEKSKLKRWQKNLLIGVAIIITSLLFAVMHGQWNVGINVFVLSIVLCLFREITGTVYAGILLHMLKNAVAFLLLYVVGLS